VSSPVKGCSVYQHRPLLGCTDTTLDIIESIFQNLRKAAKQSFLFTYVVKWPKNIFANKNNCIDKQSKINYRGTKVVL